MTPILLRKEAFCGRFYKVPLLLLVRIFNTFVNFFKIYLNTRRSVLHQNHHSPWYLRVVLVSF